MSEQKTEQRPEAFWRDANAEDVARVMKGEKVEARFRDEDDEIWSSVDNTLKGYDSTGKSEWIAGNFRWDLCQVYDPPAWFLDKPDPGEGYRLLEKFPAESRCVNDEWWDANERLWRSDPTIMNHSAQHPETWYRRRIEPNVPEIPDSSRSKDYIPSGWVKLSDDEPRLASDAYWSQVASEWCLIGEDRVNFANRSKWPAIRQAFNQMRTLLVADCCYCLPNGQKIRTTEKGFELL
jgi:hypothetical protein